MHAVITGGAGYVGLRLARRLLEQGWTVTLFDVRAPAQEGAGACGHAHTRVKLISPIQAAAAVPCFSSSFSMGTAAQRRTKPGCLPEQSLSKGI